MESRLGWRAGCRQRTMQQLPQVPAHSKSTQGRKKGGAAIPAGIVAFMLQRAWCAWGFLGQVQTVAASAQSTPAAAAGTCLQASLQSALGLLS